MKFNDILALAKQGYTPGDIKELLALTTDEPEQTPEQKTEKTAAESAESEQTTQTEKAENKEPAADQGVVDYKKLYEESQNKLQNLQKLNTNKNIKDDNTKSDDEIISDLVRSFM